MKKGIVVFIKWFIGVAAVVVFLLSLLPIGLSVVSKPKVTNKLLSRYVPQYVRATAEVERLDLRVWSTWPEVEVSLWCPVVRVTVPDSVSLSGRMQAFPHGDTLFAADTVSVRLRPLALREGRVEIRSLSVCRPQVYLTQYDTTANYDIVIPREEPDTTPSAPLQIEWEGVSVTDGRVWYACDTLGITGVTLDSVSVASSGQYKDSVLSAFVDACLRCEDASVSAKGYVSDSLDVSARVDIPHVERLLSLLPADLRAKTLKKNVLKGSVRCSASAQGYYSGGRVPSLHAFVLLDGLHGGRPGSRLSLDDLTLRAEGRYNPQVKDSTYVRIDTLSFRSGKSWLYAQGEAGYRKQRERLQLDLRSDLNLRELAELAELDETVRVKGSVKADVSTDFFLDDLLQQRIYDIHSASTVQGDNIFFGIPKARMRFSVDSLRAELKTNIARQSRMTGRLDTALLNMKVSFSQMTVKYRRSTNATIDRTTLRVYADDLNEAKPPVLHASLSLSGIRARQNDTVRVLAKRLRLSAGMHPDKEARFVPTTTARLSMDSVLFAVPRRGAMLDSVRINLSTTPRYRRFYYDRETKTRTPIPESDRQPMALDSLLCLAGSVANDSLPVETFIKRFRTTGKVYVRRMGVRRKGDPLRPTVSRMDLTLNDDTVRLNSFFLRVGRSGIALKGEVQHIRRYLLRGRTLDADLTLRSRRLDLNQLFNTISQQQREKEAEDKDKAEENMNLLSDTLSAEAMVADSLQTDSLNNRLFVLPPNLNLTFRASVDTVIFSEMRLHKFLGDVRLQDRTLSVTNMSTSTKVGKMGMSFRYSCRDTTQADVAAALSMDSVQIGELVHALPELDSLMPMLRSFDGSVASEVAAQLNLKSDMTIDLPSVNAGVWLRGQNLVLMDGETFSEIAKMLMFSKKTRNVIDSLSVEVVVRNNEVEIFPFMLSLDKYRVGVGGKQNLDGSFNYHLSVFKPLVLGLDVFGADFDHIRFKLVKPKYQSASSKIGKGGTLLRQQDADIIPNLQNSIRSYIQDLEPAASEAASRFQTGKARSD